MRGNQNDGMGELCAAGGEGAGEMQRRVMLGALGLVGMGAMAALAKAGPLNPPAGPVSSTAKPLGELEARTAINATNTPGDATGVFVISTSGSYYLADNVSVPSGMNGIKILAGALNVSIDLNGFRVRGLPGSLAGISRPTGLGGATLVVRNGVILNMGGAGIGADGQNVLVEDVGVNDCGGAGIDVAGEAARFVQCGVFRCGGNGFNFGTGVAIGCVSESNTGIGFNSTGLGSFTGCAASLNQGGGFKGTTMRASNCLASGGGTGFLCTAEMSLDGCHAVGGTTGFSTTVGTGAQLSGCWADSVGGVGFALTNSQGVQMESCVARSCSGGGFAVGPGAMLKGCSAVGNGSHGFTGSACTLTACAAYQNGAPGASVIGFNLGGECKVENCAANENAQHGYQVGPLCTVTNCTAVNNGLTLAGSTGFRATSVDTTLDGCTAIGSPVGFSATGGCILTRNRASGNTTNFSLTGTNFVGAIVTTAAGVATANGWANFEF